MPQKTKRRASNTTTTPPTTPPGNPSERGSPRATPRNPVEEGLETWTRLAQETGETVSEYLRRFGEEQQKNYESWASSFRDAAQPTVRAKDAEEIRARIGEWNRRAEEIGTRVRDAFQKNLEPQKELLDLWVKPFLPKGATDEDRSREATELMQKMWTGLTSDLSRGWFTALQPGHSVDELARVQEASLKEFYDSFQKLTQIYFTSPAFVTMFGKTLDASLDTQRMAKDQEKVFGWMTGLPSRREITELNEAVRDLTEKVTRLNTGRS